VTWEQDAPIYIPMGSPMVGPWAKDPPITNHFNPFIMIHKEQFNPVYFDFKEY
jgi:hypothetical protein